MHPIQVDMVGLQSTQARLDRSDYLLAVVAGTVRITRVGLVGELGAEHEPVSAPFEQVTEDRFRRPVGVDVGGVDDIAASVSEQVQHPRADIWGCPPAPVFTEGHGAQRHLRDPHPGLTQKPVTHEIPSLLWIGNARSRQATGPPRQSGGCCACCPNGSASSPRITGYLPLRCCPTAGTGWPYVPERCCRSSECPHDLARCLAHRGFPERGQCLWCRVRA